MFWNTFQELCKSKNLKPTPAVLEIGISRSSIDNWKNGGYPNGESLIKIADFFEVSTDYLLGRTDVPNPSNQNITATNNCIQTVQGNGVGTVTQTSGCKSEIDTLLSKLSASDQLRATADIMDLIEDRYINKKSEQGDKV